MRMNEPNEFDEVNKNDADLHFKREVPEVEEAIGINEILKWLEE